MLVSLDALQRQFACDAKKLAALLELQGNAPARYQANTEHFSSLAAITPYVYYTALVRKYVPKAAAVLDWGAYLGQVTYLLQDDYNVTAYNPFDADEIQYWHEKMGIRNRVFDRGVREFTLDFESASFDAAISSGVLEHTFEYGIEDVEALKNLRAVLKPGGYLFIWNLPTQNALAEKIARWRKRWKHPLRYGLDDVLVKLCLAGFDVVELERDEMIYLKLAKLFRPVHPIKLRQFDQMLCRLPVLRHYAHHFTVVARKVDDFPAKPAASAYTAYID